MISWDFTNGTLARCASSLLGVSACLCCRQEGGADGKLQGPLRQKDYIGSETARECNTLNGGTKLRSESVMDFAREGLVRGALGT